MEQMTTDEPVGSSAWLAAWRAFGYEWSSAPDIMLRAYPDGTYFLLTNGSMVHVCKTCGNMEGDNSWKAVRFSDCKHIRLESYAKWKFCLLAANKGIQQPNA